MRNFESVGHPILPDLLQVALKCPWFKQQQDTRSQQGGSSVGAVPGVGVKQRLGLGFSQNPAGVGREKHFQFFHCSFYIFYAIGLVAPTSSFNSADQHCAVAKPTISKTIERAKSMIGSSGVAGASKVDLMRSALKVTERLYSGSF